MPLPPFGNSPFPGGRYRAVILNGYAEAGGQIGLSEWTTAGLLRHPRFLGLRNDKAAREVRREG